MRFALLLMLAAVLHAEDQYVAAVRAFADTALAHGRDNYGPRHTPLFVDGIHFETREPVRWKSVDGRTWVLSDLGNQQLFFRTLAGLSALTGDPRYKQAAADATRYAFDHLIEGGYLVWGGHMAYNASDDVSVFAEDKTKTHELKNNYPFYELMWEIDPRTTKSLIENMWNGHILDWSTLDFNRHAFPKPMGALWKSEYKGGPVFFWGKGLTFINAAGDLYYAAAMLSQLSHDPEPLVWARRLAHRYVETRNPKTGIGGYQFSQAASSWCDDVGNIRGDRAQYFYAEDFPGHLVVEGTLFPTYGSTPEVHPRIAMFVLGEILGAQGQEFTQWAREELTAWGKAAYRAADNSFIPMLTDGTSMEGYTVRKDGYFGPKGRVLKAGRAGAQDFYTYALGYRITGDPFLLEMANRIRAANSFEKGGDPFALLGFLELYRKRKERPLLQAAQSVGGNILAAGRFHSGWVKFDSLEPLALLHLSAALQRRSSAVPPYNGGSGFFSAAYGNLGNKYDRFLYGTK
ncbi:MAG: pectate lyase [Acidobacteria bacterium]|nr:pectate lyase [Acidobacteriota bacterium]